MVAYQTHDPAHPGMSDSFRKLERLRLPQDMSGWRVLDIGCNEGFFCNVAATRGAREVVALDFTAGFLESGLARYPHPAIDWCLRDWRDPLPAGPFDLVMWCSAMHYDADPARMFARIADILSPTGLFVLECGVAPSGGREMVLVARHSDNCWYPTHEFLHRALEQRFVPVRVAAPEATQGDPVPREAFQCRLRLPTVIVLREDTRDVLGDAAGPLYATATKAIDIGAFLTRLARAQFAHDPVVALLQAYPQADDVGERLRIIDAAELTGQWADLLARAVAPSDKLVLLDGPLTDAQVEALARHLEGRADVRCGHRG